MSCCWPAWWRPGSAIGLFAVWWETALAQRIPPHLLSRVSAWDWMGSLALLPLGFLLAGPVAERLGSTEVLVGGGLVGAVGMALGLLSSEVRTLGRFSEEPGPIEPLRPDLPDVPLRTG